MGEHVVGQGWLVLGSNPRMSAERVAVFMDDLDAALKGWWPISPSSFSPEDMDEVDLPEWEQQFNWVLIEEDGKFMAHVSSDEGIRFTEQDYRKWRVAGGLEDADPRFGDDQ